MRNLLQFNRRRQLDHVHVFDLEGIVIVSVEVSTIKFLDFVVRRTVIVVQLHRMSTLQHIIYHFLLFCTYSLSFLLGVAQPSINGGESGDAGVVQQMTGGIQNKNQSRGPTDWAF